MMNVFQKADAKPMQRNSIVKRNEVQQANVPDKMYAREVSKRQKSQSQQ
jgi:hypothetical protein